MGSSIYSLIGYSTGFYQKAVRCSQCGKMIPAGSTVFGKLRAGRSLSNRMCRSCHDKREDKVVKILSRSKRGK